MIRLLNMYISNKVRAKPTVDNLPNNNSILTVYDKVHIICTMNNYLEFCGIFKAVIFYGRMHFEQIE